MPLIDRREFIRWQTAGLAGAAMVPGVIAAGAPGPEARAASRGAPRGPRPTGFYRFELGDAEVTILSDGSFRLPAELFGAEHFRLAVNVEEDTRERFFHDRLVPPDDAPLQASPVLVSRGGHRTQVDTGWGPEAGDPGGGEGLPTPDAGSLLRTLAMVGVAPESIDTVVLTHAHPDHMGGLVDPVTREPLLPNAEVLISDAELKLWTAEDAADRVGELAAMLVPGAQADLAALDERLRPIQPGSEVASGIHTVPAPGHTPGHMALIVEGDGEQLFLVGDSVTNIHSAFERPEWQLRLDVDGELAGRTRRRLLERAVADEMLILGYHFPFPGLGRALPYQGAFRWYPAGWTVLP